ncbi:mast cell carboxypeptidase A-like [Plodia interpunctella]|uniref:mast cell carboxypeptidase A-like n=1 Tax=Plodia interpunctella TaxID=58824 RepID=UPI003100C90E
MDVIVDDCCTNEFETMLQYNNIEYSSINLGPTFGDIQRNELPGDKFAKRDKFPDYTNLMDQIDNIASDTSKIKKRVISRTFDKIELFVLEMDVFWVKNRNAFFPQTKCRDDSEYAIGVDIDRNWFFGENNDDNICYSLYIGPSSLSEKETKAFSEYVNSIADKLMAFINLRGSGQRIITIPYGHTLDYSSNHNVMMSILRSANHRVQSEHRVKYLYERTSKYFYNFSGNSCDWVKKKLNVPIVYMMHLQNVEEILMSPKDIEPLTREFTTIIKETLVIARNIYGPLFNSKNMLFVSIKTKCILVLNFLFLLSINI